MALRSNKRNMLIYFITVLGNTLIAERSFSDINQGSQVRKIICFIYQ